MIKQVREEGLTALLVEQNVHKGLEIADRAYVLENGRITLDGDSSGLLEDERIHQAYLEL